MSNNFHVGQRIECIPDEGWNQPAIYGEVMPEGGRIYTVRDAMIGHSGEPCVRLCEIKNAPEQYLDGFRECIFTSRSFRPVVDRPTSIEVFNRILLDCERKKQAVEG